MLTLILSCLLFLADVTHPNDTPALSVDRIEVNHVWTAREKDIGNITIEEGYCSMDQLIVWKYNEYQDRFEVVHWEMLKNCRLKDRLTGEDREEHLKGIDRRRTHTQRAEAKRNGVSFEDIVTYIDSDWVGFNNELNRPRYNFSSEKWEVTILVRDRYYKFVANGYVETNTLYDPETIFRLTHTTYVGRTRFEGFSAERPKISPYILLPIGTLR